MGFIQEWKALSARIHGLLNAGRFFFDVRVEIRDTEKKALKNIFQNRIEAITQEITSFKNSYQASLSAKATQCLDRILSDFSQAETKYKNRKDISYVHFLLTHLAAFEAEFTYHLSDTQAIAKRTVERAFVHLQSSIMADKNVKTTWQNAFERKRGEEWCEKLGAAHLLLHGIWAFKAHADPGGRTDLVLGESILNTDKVEATADALVLTEWKKVDNPKKTSENAEVAFNQAKLYTEGVLAGIELSGYRYLILVSGKHLPEIPDRKDNAVTYRHINIAVNPERPSDAARRIRQKKIK